MYVVGQKSGDGNYLQDICPDYQMLDREGNRVRTIGNVQMYLDMLNPDLSFHPSNVLENNLFDTIRAASLRKEEIFAIILYTGPNFHIYNSILRRYPVSRYKLYSNGITCPRCHEACNVVGKFVDKHSSKQVCSGCDERGDYPASECIQCVSSTCSSEYLLCPKCVKALPDSTTGSGNLFTTTIFTLVSAIQKLSRTVIVPPGTLLYRGMGGTLEMPDCFYSTDKHGCSGYCEMAFMSTSASRSEAISYSGLTKGKPKASIMVIHPSSVDRGAYISDFSQ
jgi:hypothetical protein